MDFLYIKALHVIFVITWFAGLFYIVRLFIYQVEAEDKTEPAKYILQNQYKLMSKRLWYIITWPSAILASIFAFWMLIERPHFLLMPWMHIKLSFVFALYLYHYSCQKIYSQLQKDIVKYSAFKLRIWNEVATIILFAVIFLVMLRDSLNWIWGVAGIFVFGIVLMLSIKLYKRIREKKSWDNAEKKILDDIQDSKNNHTINK
ncbi:CopD family protein [Polaribacter sp.]|uniref:CopD family protein n=1 Tax=Polaribacter sp. TaxID=1920175 RepID=UPI0040476E66